MSAEPDLRALSVSPLQPGPPPKDRVTVVEQIYHQPVEGRPTQIDAGFDRLLETSEQVFWRSRTIGEEWEPLVPDRCWLDGDKIGMVIVCNDQGRYSGVQRVQPTEAEKTAAARQVLEISLDSARTNPLLVCPRESQRLTVRNTEAIAIRASSGQVRCTVYVFPR